MRGDDGKAERRKGGNGFENRNDLPERLLHAGKKIVSCKLAHLAARLLTGRM